MSHERKKGGQRKDKKVARMRLDIADRHLHQSPESPQTDQKDVVNYKPGSHSDHNREPRPNYPGGA